MKIGTKTTFEEHLLRIRYSTLLRVESPPVPNTCNIRDALNTALLEKYEIGLDYFLKFFTMITDSVAVKNVSQMPLLASTFMALMKNGRVA